MSSSNIQSLTDINQQIDFPDWLKDPDYYFDNIPNHKKLNKFNGWKDIFRSVAQSLQQSTLVPYNTSDVRRFIGIASAEVVDTYGTVIELSHLRDWLPKMVERRIPISVEHTDYIPGYIEDFELMTLGEARDKYGRSHPKLFERVKVTEENKNTLSLISHGRIHEDYPEVDDVIWELIQRGYFTGLSIRAWGERLKDSERCDLEKRCGEVIRNARIVAVTLTREDEQSNPKSVIIAKMRERRDKLLSDVNSKLGILARMQAPQQVSSPTGKPDANSAFEILLSIREQLSLIVEEGGFGEQSQEPSQESVNPENPEGSQNSQNFNSDEPESSQKEDANMEDPQQDTSSDVSNDCPDCGAQMDRTDYGEKCPECGLEQIENDEERMEEDSEEDEEEEGIERMKNAETTPSKTKDKSKISPDDLVPVPRAKLAQLTRMAQQTLEQNTVKDPTLEKIDAILNGKIDPTESETRSIDIALKERLKSLSDEELLEYGISRSQTPEIPQSAQGRLDPTASNGGSNGAGSEGKTNLSYPEVKQWYFENMRRMPSQQETQLHCQEGYPLPSPEEILQVN